MDLESGLESHTSSSTSPSVEFVNVLDKYSCQRHLKCHYILKNYDVQEGDRVGIYKIGWKLLKEFVLFEWASREFSDHVTFTKYRLPQNSTDYYQFCFISGENNVYGASKPFQFYQLYIAPDNVDCIEFLPAPFNRLDRAESIPDLVENFNGVKPSNDSNEPESECESEDSVPDLVPVHPQTKACESLPNCKVTATDDEEPEGEDVEEDCSEYEDEEDCSEYEDEEECNDIDGDESDYSDSESMPSLTGYPETKNENKPSQDSGDHASLQSSCGSLPELVMIESIPELMSDLSTSNNDNESGDCISSFIITSPLVDEKNIEEEKQEKDQKLHMLLEHSKVLSENDHQIIEEKSRQIEKLLNENRHLHSALAVAKLKNAENEKHNKEKRQNELQKYEMVLEYTKLMSEKDRNLLESRKEEIGLLDHQCYCTAIREIQAKQNKHEKEYQQLHTNSNYAKIIEEKNKEIIEIKSGQIENLLQTNQHYRDMLDKTNSEFKEEVEGLYAECDELTEKFESVHKEVTEGISQLKLETENLCKSINTKENEFITSTDSMKFDMLKLNNITKEFETRFHSQEQQILNLQMSLAEYYENYKRMTLDNEDLRATCRTLKNLISDLLVVKNADIGELKSLPPLPLL